MSTSTMRPRSITPSSARCRLPCPMRRRVQKISRPTSLTLRCFKAPSVSTWTLRPKTSREHSNRNAKRRRRPPAPNRWYCGDAQPRKPKLQLQASLHAKKLLTPKRRQPPQPKKARRWLRGKKRQPHVDASWSRPMLLKPPPKHLSQPQRHPPLSKRPSSKPSKHRSYADAHDAPSLAQPPCVNNPSHSTPPRGQPGKKAMRKLPGKMPSKLGASSPAIHAINFSLPPPIAWTASSNISGLLQKRPKTTHAAAEDVSIQHNSWCF